MMMGESNGLSVLWLVLAVIAVSLWIARKAPADLLVAPERPYQAYGNPDVRTETRQYPRYATGADNVCVRVDWPARRIIAGVAPGRVLLCGGATRAGRGSQ
jgi:hypothetical protein